jgi:hypothetical protein
MIATTLKDVVSKARRDMDEVSKFVSLQNIGRYQRLLRRQLTDLEREFVERRLAEERQALKSSEMERLSRGARAGSAIKIAIVSALLSSLSEVSLSSFGLVEQVGLLG